MRSDEIVPINAVPALCGMPTSMSASLVAIGLTAGFITMILGWSLQRPVTGVAAHHSYVVVTAALRRRALERLRAAANLKLDKPAPRAAPKEAWESFAKDIDGAASVLEAKPRASPKDAWGNFAKEGNAEGEGKGGGAKKKHP